MKIQKGAIGKYLDRIRNMLDSWLGKPIRSFSATSVKLTYQYISVEGYRRKLKIEINTIEHLQIDRLQKVLFVSNNSWFKGEATISTYSIDELMATKLRALYQRRKGRDLFDLWVTLMHNLIDVEHVIAILQKYLTYNGQSISKADFLDNLHQKRLHKDFQNDIKALLPVNSSWDFQQALDYGS